MECKKILFVLFVVANVNIFASDIKLTGPSPCIPTMQKSFNDINKEIIENNMKKTLEALKSLNKELKANNDKLDMETETTIKLTSQVQQDLVQLQKFTYLTDHESELLLHIKSKDKLTIKDINGNSKITK